MNGKGLVRRWLGLIGRIPLEHLADDNVQLCWQLDNL